MIPGNGQIQVPPGFRFHPTEEELLNYYLKKKVTYESIDLDVIREVDLNKLEPWDLKDKCRIGTGSQNEWYFFSHKDKKYPTGSRTNRATIAGFWKATGRDKAIYLGNSSKRIGMRKTLVFYTGRAPHGQKTDWIMHEYRLDDENPQLIQQEDGWVVCRVFVKKNHGRGLQQEDQDRDDEYSHRHHSTNSITCISPILPPIRQNNYIQPLTYNYNHTFDHGTIHLPQLSSPDSLATIGLTTMDNLLRLTTSSGGGGGGDRRFINGGDSGFLDKLLTSYQSLDQSSQNKVVVANHDQDHDIIGTTSANINLLHHHKSPFHQY